MHAQWLEQPGAHDLDQWHVGCSGAQHSGDRGAGVVQPQQTGLTEQRQLPEQPHPLIRVGLLLQVGYPDGVQR